VPSAATRPNKPAVLPADASVVVYRAVEGWPIHWRDSFGVVHACETSEAHDGLMLSWTICGNDVYDNGAYVSRNMDEVTCPACAKERWSQRHPNGPEPAWIPNYKPQE
jgi:hypothetical protein